MTKIKRSFNCRNEELVPIAKFTTFALKRDLNKISQVYNNITPDYIATTEALITEVDNLIEPQAETLAKKQVTKALSESMQQLTSQINYLAAYLKLSNKVLRLTATDFGITKLRRAINKGDAEAVVENLKIVLTHIKDHSDVLTANGMGSNFVTTLEALLTKINADRQTQFELLSNRKNIVQNNLDKLNELYNRIVEIHIIGKSIFSKSTDVKNADYTFTKLLSNVRQKAKAQKTLANTVNK